LNQEPDFTGKEALMAGLTAAVRRLLSHPVTARFGRCLLGLILLVSAGVWLASFGVTLTVRAGGSAAAQAGLLLALAAATTALLVPIPALARWSTRPMAALWMGLALLLPLATDWLEQVGITLLGSGQDLSVLLIVLVAYGLPLVGMAFLITPLLSRAAVLAGTGPLTPLLSLAAGLLWLFAPESGSPLWMQSFVAVGMGCSALCLVRKQAEPESATVPKSQFAPISAPLSLVDSIAIGLLIIAAGWMLLLSGRVSEQLVPGTIHLAVAPLAALFFGLLVGNLLPVRTARSTVCLLAMLGGLLAFWMGAFPLHMSWARWASARIEQPGLLFVVRMLLAAPPGLLIGLTVGMLARRLPQTVATPWLFVAGWVAAQAILPERSVALLVQVGALMWFAPLALLTWSARREVVNVLGNGAWGMRRQRLAQATSLAGAVALLATPWLTSTYRPDLAARTLFSTAVFENLRAGTDPTELAWLDEGRLILQVEGTTGTFTAHRYGGAQWQLRKNGLPLGGVSSDETAFPNFSGDVLLAALPLALHEQPERVLLLGLGTGEVLSTTIACPILTADCVEADRALLALHRGPLAAERGTSPFSDERVAVRVADPHWFVRTPGPTYDVILSQPDYPILATAAASHTREFYRDCSRKLSAEGIFAQRIRITDLGPAVLTTLIATLQSEFPSVILFDTAPGEFLLVASPSGTGLVRKGLVDRLRAGHLQQRLATAGVDWSMLLNLAAWSRDDLMKLLAANRPEECTRSNPNLLFSIPSEAYSWAPKQQQIGALFHPYRARLANWCGQDGDSPEVVRRLAEVAGQQDLMLKYGDEFWAYRKAVREQVTSKPRSLLKDAHGKSGDRLHDEDRRRIQYFQSLKVALEKRDGDSLARLESFERPYDPLLSFFVHAEAAEILAKFEPRQPARELAHRLHTVYYAPTHTRSVRAVVEALRLVNQFPEAVSDPSRRWSVQSALLTALDGRWSTRREVTSNASRQLLSDLDTSLLLARQTLDSLAQTHTAAGVAAEEWQARERVLNRTLVTRLEGFRQSARVGGATPVDTPAESPTAPALSLPMAN
jgi:hypothetical protein